MKKILLLFTAAGLLSLTSCNNDDDVVVSGDGDTIAENYEVTNVNFATGGTSSSITIPLNPNIPSSDMIVVYRYDGADPDNGNDVWRSLPTTYYFNDGSFLDYNFDFSIDKVVIYLDGDFNLSTYPTAYTQNQIFRALIIPGYLTATGKQSAPVDLTNYDAVVKYYNIKDSDIKTIKL
ncbi:hypothetical protein [Flavobacterium subsaxonicum]|uniref:Uncharacterized protein n=1 Tax=Flavobacterium subsaxonicum WB 4.1-42 = DSM 21790 TaxID=1121898 RepID=A0A0A2MJT6_9FLAO|nr:hypothetical protein [Flavobacterium subsaxonicum]KGO92549.1 hypothetical protein Q766_12270 [Flavobacterium subsaxonicum WB 4.1-42 = DSM 21790]